MNKTYILIDTHNMWHRAKHVNRVGDVDMRIGMTVHIMLSSIKKSWNDFNADHVVFCNEGSSWRKKVYEPYKKNRKVMQSKKTDKEREDDELFMESLNEFIDYLENKTNCSVLKAPNSEADDLISIWIREHPDDEHIIISSDADFHQLLSDNVKIYDGIKEHLITIDGIYDKLGNEVIDKKTRQPKPAPDPEFSLFEKCIRGDKSDNIFPAYPGARMKSSKKKVGIKEAFEDRYNKGYAWNNFMMTSWDNHEDEEVTVRERYEENKNIIDLTKQPSEIEQECIDEINRAKNAEPKKATGFSFLKFCGEWDLQTLSRFPKDFTRIFNAGYK